MLLNAQLSWGIGAAKMSHTSLLAVVVLDANEILEEVAGCGVGTLASCISAAVAVELKHLHAVGVKLQQVMRLHPFSSVS